MSTTGDRAVGQPDYALLAGLGAPPEDREGYLAWQVRALRAVSSPAFAFDEAWAAARAARAYDRGHDPQGWLRQAIAVVASGDRTPRLRGLRVPALVIHGADDPMCNVSGGRATAAAIPGAELVVFDHMGHGMPRPLWPELTTHIVDLVRRADASAR